MKLFIGNTIFIICLAATSFTVEAQFIKVLGKQVENQLRNRASQRVGQAVDKGLDKVEDAAKGKSNDNRPKSKKEKESKTIDDDNNVKNTAVMTNGEDNEAAPPTCDFVAGRNIVFFQDFNQLRQGAFPSNWRSTGNGEVVKLNGSPQNWLSINTQGAYMPEINNLPVDFTLEIDLACPIHTETEGFSLEMVNLSDKSQFYNWEKGTGKDAIGKGIKINFKPGNSSYIIQSGSEQSLQNERQTTTFLSGDKNSFVHISITKQSQHIRVYLNKQKIWDLPEAFTNPGNVNSMIFRSFNSKNPRDIFYITNIKLATGDFNTALNR